MGQVLGYFEEVWKMEAEEASSPTWAEIVKSVKSWEKLFRPSQRGRLSEPKQFRDDLRTFLRDRCFDGGKKQTYGVPSTTRR